MAPETTLLWTVIAAIGASVSAVAAAVYTALTYRLVRLQADPHVIVYTAPDIDRPSIIMLVIENVGRDVAHDIRFTPERPLPSRAFGIDFATAHVAEPMTAGPFVEGIPALGPRSQRFVTWGQYGGLHKSIGDCPIRLRFTYRAGKRSFSGETQLEVRSYLETDASRKPAVRVADHLEKVVSKFDRCVSHLDRIASALAKPPRRKSRYIR